MRKTGNSTLMQRYCTMEGTVQSDSYWEERPAITLPHMFDRDRRACHSINFPEPSQCHTWGERHYDESLSSILLPPPFILLFVISHSVKQG